MTTELLQTLKRRLEEKALEFGLIRYADNIRVEPAADELDRTVDASARDLAIAQVTLEARAKRAVAAALQRMKLNEYGLCVRCEKDIQIARLKAIPWAERCVPCQEAYECRRAEEGAQEGESDLVEVLINASRQEDGPASVLR